VLKTRHNVGHKVGDNYRKSDIIVENRSGLENQLEYKMVPNMYQLVAYS